MRFAAYLAAVLAAAGIVYVIGAPDSSAPAEANAASAAGETAASEAGQGEQLVVNVPGMHCVFACYPSVKKALEATEGVQGVELVEQQEDNAIDDPTLIVTYTAGFDRETALAAIAKAGFDEAAVVEN